jgi:hypothetical protein
MKFYKIDEDTIEFARDIINVDLQLRYLDKICRELIISCEVAFVDDTGNQYMAKRYRNNINSIKLILMSKHFILNGIVGKSVVNCCKITRNIKLSSLIANLMRKNIFIALPMKYCYTSVNITPLKITVCYRKLIKVIKTYGKYKDSYELIYNLLLGSYNYHGRLKQMIKQASYV